MPSRQSTCRRRGGRRLKAQPTSRPRPRFQHQRLSQPILRPLCANPSLPTRISSQLLSGDAEPAQSLEQTPTQGPANVASPPVLFPRFLARSLLPLILHFHSFT